MTRAEKSLFLNKHLKSSLYYTYLLLPTFTYLLISLNLYAYLLQLPRSNTVVLTFCGYKLVFFQEQIDAINQHLRSKVSIPTRVSPACAVMDKHSIVDWETCRKRYYVSDEFGIATNNQQSNCSARVSILMYILILCFCLIYISENIKKIKQGKKITENVKW